MNRYSVMATDGRGIASNSVCDTLGKIMDAVIDGLQYDHKIKIVKIPPESDNDNLVLTKSIEETQREALEIVGNLALRGQVRLNKGPD